MANFEREFGQHLRSLRRARGLSQEQLARRSTLSVDTIRRLEYGRFSPSVDTLRKLCAGLGLRPSTLFESFELGVHDERRAFDELVGGRSPRQLASLARIVRAILDEFDELGA